MFSSEMDRIIFITFILAIVGAVLGAWKLIEFIIWIINHVHISW